ncbi:hypothetical protein T05_15745 [Trichinella murrelli]|uniref:Uncharacterized protein n=1 Tax=Trichinella murrelli TaxID=144512 RepID=A0A0V0T2I1_9BILA|nr:hypothetical protein T05_15745 [Trichinella murrelli]
MLGAEMEVRVEEGGEGVLSISVLPPKKSSDVSLCGSKPKRQKSQTTLKYIWNSNMNHKANEKRRMNNGAFNAMTDEEDH